MFQEAAHEGLTMNFTVAAGPAKARHGAAAVFHA